MGVILSNLYLPGKAGKCVQEGLDGSVVIGSTDKGWIPQGGEKRALKEQNGWS